MPSLGIDLVLSVKFHIDVESQRIRKHYRKHTNIHLQPLVKTHYLDQVSDLRFSSYQKMGILIPSGSKVHKIYELEGL